VKNIDSVEIALQAGEENIDHFEITLLPGEENIDGIEICSSAIWRGVY
jgi:hypothetical protein